MTGVPVHRRRRPGRDGRVAAALEYARMLPEAGELNVLSGGEAGGRRRRRRRGGQQARGRCRLVVVGP